MFAKAEIIETVGPVLLRLTALAGLTALFAPLLAAFVAPFTL